MQAHNLRNAEFFLQITQQTIYLMGISFILGSLVTIFVLLILDMVRAAKLEIDAAEPAEPEEDEDSADHAA